MSSTPDRYVIIKMEAVFCEACDTKQASTIMRQTVDHLVNVEGLHLDDPDDRDVFGRADPSPIEWSDRPVFLSGHSSHALLLDHFWEPAASYHYLMLSLDSDVPRDELSQEWRLLLERSLKVVNLVKPHFAFALGRVLADKRNPIPYESLKPGSLPSSILPWTLIGTGSNPGDAEKLEKLPAHRQEKLQAGWLFEAVAVPGQPPADGLIEGLQSLGVNYEDLLLK